jgi:hypothetical protein
MKAFVKNLLVNFLIIISCFVALLFFIYKLKYTKTRVPIIKNELFYDQTKNMDTVSFVLGSSHTYFGIDSKAIDSSTFNFASISQSLMEDYGILANVKNPIKRVIIPISYFTNWYYLYKTPIGGEKLRTIDYQFLYEIKYPSYLDSRDFVNFASELTKSLSKKAQRFDNKGNIVGRCEYSVNKFEDSKIAFERHNMGKNFNVIHPYLDSINKFCIKNKIELYLIIMPFSQDYRKYISQSGFDKYLEILKANYSNENCTFLDFRKHFKLSEEQIMFRDADHLSICGRDSFSKFLSKQFKTIR